MTYYEKWTRTCEANDGVAMIPFRNCLGEPPEYTLLASTGNVLLRFIRKATPAEWKAWLDKADIPASHRELLAKETGGVVEVVSEKFRITK